MFGQYLSAIRLKVFENFVNFYVLISFLGFILLSKGNISLAMVKFRYQGDLRNVI